MDIDAQTFLESLLYRIADWHSECDCYACQDMQKAICDIEQFIDRKENRK